MSGFVEPYQVDGVWMVPRRAETDDPNGPVGVGFVPLTRDNPQYDDWMEYIRAGDSPGWVEQASQRMTR